MQQLTSFRMQRTGHSKIRRRELRVDMTPMVDLGFLLITFFVFTAQISRGKELDLYMPADREGNLGIPEGKVITILLSAENHVYYYAGSWESAKNENKIFQTNYSLTTGIGSVIRRKQQQVDQKFGTGSRRELMLLIKPAQSSTYQKVVDMLDEILINDVRKYAILELSADERTFLKE